MAMAVVGYRTFPETTASGGPLLIVIGVLALITSARDTRRHSVHSGQMS